MILMQCEQNSHKIVVKECWSNFMWVIENMCRIHTKEY